MLLVTGFLVRVWATYHFYEHRMKVISLAPQQTLITSGPYRFSRNPLYLGGNVLIFFGAALLFGSPTALVFTAVHLPLVDIFIRREERQLERLRRGMDTVQSAGAPMDLIVAGKTIGIMCGNLDSGCRIVAMKYRGAVLFQEQPRFSSLPGTLPFPRPWHLGR